MRQQILLSNHPFISRLFRGKLRRVFWRLSTPGIVLIAIAFILRVASISGRTRLGVPGDFGYLYAWNWSLMYTIVLPGIFVGFIKLARYATNSINVLEQDGILICKKDEQTGTGVIREHLERRSNGLVLTCLLLAICVIYVDTIDIASGFYVYSVKQPITQAVSVTDQACPYPFAEEDWTVAFAPWCGNTREVNTLSRPTITQNLLFDIGAYLLEGIVIFLGFFWAGKIWQFLYCFSGLLESHASGVDLEPNIEDDLYRRFGLYPLGIVYDFFLALILLFELYVFGHRLQLIKARGGMAVGAYLAYLAKNFKSPEYWLRADFYRFDTMSPGMLMLILGISLPAITICWLPLYKLRLYLIKIKTSLTGEYRAAKEKARAIGDDATFRDFSQRLAKLNTYSVWPNGDTSGMILLLTTLVLWISAVLPPVFVSVVPAIVVPLLVSLGKKVVGRKEATES